MTASFKILVLHFPGKNKENHKNLHSENLMKQYIFLPWGETNYIQLHKFFIQIILMAM